MLNWYSMKTIRSISRYIIPITFFLILVIFGYYAIPNIKNTGNAGPIQNLPTTTPIPTTTFTPSLSTNNYNTYKSPTEGFTLQYPAEWGETYLEPFTILGSRFNWYKLNTQELSDCGGLCTGSSPRTQIKFDNLTAIKIIGSISGVDITLPQSYICYQIARPYNQHIMFCLWELPLNLGEDEEKKLAKRKPQPISSEDEAIVEHIINSLKFN